MVPFRVFDREKKELWIVLNHHSHDGSYMAAREDDADRDFEMRVIPATELAGMRFVDFLDDNDLMAE